jgi:hypothetical protein
VHITPCHKKPPFVYKRPNNIRPKRRRAALPAYIYKIIHRRKKVNTLTKIPTPDRPPAFHPRKPLTLLKNAENSVYTVNGKPILRKNVSALSSFIKNEVQSEPFVIVEFPVATDERRFFGDCLRDDDSVGGVFVVSLFGIYIFKFANSRSIVVNLQNSPNFAYFTILTCCNIHHGRLSTTNHSTVCGLMYIIPKFIFNFILKPHLAKRTFLKTQYMNQT